MTNLYAVARFFKWPAIVLGLAVILLFMADGMKAAEPPTTVDTRTGDAYETPNEKTVILSDGRKMICLQASAGALWCTPALK